MNPDFLLAVLRVERARLGTIIAEVDAIGIGLKAGLITPAQAVEHMHQMNLIGPIAQDAVVDQKALIP
jgi:hypothetical protein